MKKEERAQQVEQKREDKKKSAIENAELDKEDDELLKLREKGFGDVDSGEDSEGGDGPQSTGTKDEGADRAKLRQERKIK